MREIGNEFPEGMIGEDVFAKLKLELISALCKTIKNTGYGNRGFFFLLISLGLKCPETYDLSEYIVTQVTIRPPSIKGSETDRLKVNKIVQHFHQSNKHEILEKSLGSVTVAKTKVNLSDMFFIAMGKLARFFILMFCLIEFQIPAE